MTPLDRLSRPIVAAPMAGGVSTSALVHAAAAAGGIGFLAAGYLAPATVEEQIRQVRGLFGLNIFLPDGVPPDHLAVAAYRELLQDEFRQSLPAPPPAQDDHWQSKLDIAIGLRVPLVSFTFACPPAAAVARLHAAETFVIATVTTADEALAAAEAGVDALCLQGAGAGAHRGSFAEQTNTKGAAEPELPEMVARVRESVRLPVIAAGGIATPAHVREVLEAGAVAAQIGTALLRTPESGAHPVHKAALADPAFTATADRRPATTGDPHRATTRDPHRATTGDAHHAATTDPRAATTGDAHHATTGDPRRAATTDPRAATTGDPHHAATGDPRDGTTVVTRAFTGRPARALRNEFVARFDGAAPWAYPDIHYVTKPLRDAAAARGDAGGMALWAGINHAMAQARPAAEVIAHLSGAKMA